MNILPVMCLWTRKNRFNFGSNRHLNLELLWKFWEDSST